MRLRFSDALLFVAAVSLGDAFVHRGVVERRTQRWNRQVFQSQGDSTDTQAVSAQEIVTESVAPPKAAFVNDGPFSWLVDYLKMGGFTQEGKSLVGAIPMDVDKSKLVSAEEASERRKEAAAKLMNIGMDERDRRDEAGTIVLAVAAVYATWAALIADDGGLAGHLVRFMVVLPLGLGWGFKLSAKEGLWNIAQAGVWDVDGNGLSKIEEPDLARAILDKVNSLNVDIASQAALAAAAFAVLPQSVCAPLIGSSLLFAGLYALNGKIPKDV